MRPGDLIEWVYKQDGNIVLEREILWSSLMKRYVPIGSGHVHALISIDSEQITWMNEEGLFRARVNDTLWTNLRCGRPTVVPRARE